MDDIRDLRFLITILHKYLDEVILFLVNVIFVRNFEGSPGKRVYHCKF